MLWAGVRSGGPALIARAGLMQHAIDIHVWHQRSCDTAAIEAGCLGNRHLIFPWYATTLWMEWD